MSKVYFVVVVDAAANYFLSRRSRFTVMYLVSNDVIGTRGKLVLSWTRDRFIIPKIPPYRVFDYIL